MLSVLKKVPLLSLTAMEDADLNKTIGGDDVSIRQELHPIGYFPKPALDIHLILATGPWTYKNILATIVMRSTYTSAWVSLMRYSKG